MRNTTTSYGSVAKFLHWIIGLFIITLIAIGLYMSDMPDSELKWAVFDAHKATGVVVFVLVALRFLWRLINPVPALPEGTSKSIKIAANVSHYTIYLMMFASPISGVLMSIFSGNAINMYNLYTIAPLVKNDQISTIAAQSHIYLGYFWIVMITLHILAALYHHFIFKDDVLIKMLPDTQSYQDFREYGCNFIIKGILNKQCCALR